MRPSKQESDLEYWCKAIQYWKELAEKYFLIDDHEGEARCEARAFIAELNYQEAKGEIVVYTGRPKPRWAS